MIIYKITNNITGKSYIGQTIQKFERRIRGHKNNHTKNSPLCNAIQKYGKENFTYEILCSALKQEHLDELEKYFINYYNTVRPHGYNLTLGGQNGQIFSDETRAKMSAKAKGRVSSMKGKHHTEETKAFLKEKLIKQGKIALGYKWTEEQKKKLSSSKKGVPSKKKGKKTGPISVKYDISNRIGKKRGPYKNKKSPDNEREKV